MKNYTLYLCVLAALSLGSLKGGPVLPLTQVPSIQEFEDFIKTSSLWRELETPEGLIYEETVEIEEALEAEKLTCPIVINRPISEFKGSILFIGGGQLAGQAGFVDYKALTYVEPHLNRIAAYKNATLPFELEDGLKIETEEDRQKAIADIQANFIDPVQDKYYTIDINPAVQPDLVASITDVEGLAHYFKDHQFDKIIYEGVPLYVFLDPRTWESTARLCKPGGIIEGAVISDSRLLSLILKGTKWEGQLSSFLKATHNPAYYKYIEQLDLWADTHPNDEPRPEELESQRESVWAKWATLELIN